MGTVMQCPDCGAQRTGPNQFVKGYCRPCHMRRYIAQYRADGRERPRIHRRAGTRKARTMLCACGHIAVHYNFPAGGYIYHLCEDCYQLETAQ